MALALFILAGILLIIFRKPFAFQIISFLNTVWGFDFVEREKAISEIIIASVGALFILLSLLEIVLF